MVQVKTTLRANPQTIASIAQQGKNIIVGTDGGGVAGNIAVYLKRAGIVAVETVAGAKPHKTGAVLYDRDDRTLRQAIFNR